MHGLSWNLLYMMKQKGFHDSQEINFWISFYFFQKLDLSVFVDLEKFQPWYIESELWRPKTSSFMHGLSWNLLYMMKQKGFHDSQEINFWISFYFFQKLDLSVFVDLEKFQPWYIESELWRPKTSSFMHGLSWNLLYMMKQ